MFRASVERWRPLAQTIAPDLDARHVLATIQRESGGEPGLLGSSGDLGLMQVHPDTLRSYNEHHAPISRAQMLGRSADDAAAQIRAGTWYLRRCLNNARGLLGAARAPWPAGPATDDQIRFSDLAYSAGFRGLTEYRAAVLKTGAPDTFEALAAAAPGPPSLTVPQWRIPPRKFSHARAVLWLTRNDGAAGTPPPPIHREREPKRAPASDGAPLAIIAAAALLIFGVSKARRAPRRRQARTA